VGEWNKQFKLSNGKAFEDVFNAISSAWMASPSKTLIVNVASVSAFVAGADTLTVMSVAAGDNKLVDFGANKCISDQPVKILPQ